MINLYGHQWPEVSLLSKSWWCDKVENCLTMQWVLIGVKSVEVMWPISGETLLLSVARWRLMWLWLILVFYIISFCTCTAIYFIKLMHKNYLKNCCILSLLQALIHNMKHPIFWNVSCIFLIIWNTATVILMRLI